MDDRSEIKLIASLLAVQSGFNRRLAEALVESGALSPEAAVRLFAGYATHLTQIAADRSRNENAEVMIVASDVFAADRDWLLKRLSVLDTDD